LFRPPFGSSIPEENAALAEDLARPASFLCWATDLGSPKLLAMLRKRMGGSLDAAGAPPKFAPAEGAEFFARHGWRLMEFHSLLPVAAKLKRLPLLMRPFAWFPDPAGKDPTKPWSAVCLLAKKH
jgi:hypothetical protein